MHPTFICSPILVALLDEHAVAHDPQVRTMLKAHLATDSVRTGQLLQLVDEFALERGAYRADVVSTAQALCGYEIKAGKDCLRRLPEQAVAYGRVFAQCTLVTVPAKLNDAAKLLPTWWSLLVATGTGRNLRLHLLRNGCDNPKRDPIAIVTLLWREEILVELKRLGMSRGIGGKPRGALAKLLAAELPIDELDAIVRRQLLARREAAELAEEVQLLAA